MRSFASLHNLGERLLRVACLALLISGCSGPSGNFADGTARQQGSSSSAKRTDGRGLNADGSPEQLSGEVGAMAGMSLVELLSYAEDLRIQNEAEDHELRTLSLINKELCGILALKRSSCPAVRPLYGEDSDGVAACLREIGASAAPKIEVEIPGNVSQVLRLQGDEFYESSAFSGGKTEITFRDASGASLAAPSFVELASLALIPSEEGGGLPPLGMNLKISVGGHELLDVLVRAPTDPYVRSLDSAYEVPLRSVLELRNSSRCVTTVQEIDDAKNLIRNARQAQIAQSRKAGYDEAQANIAAYADLAPQEEAEKRAELEKEASIFQTQISQRLTLLDPERDRTMDLTHLLRGGGKLGCMARVPIDTLEVSFEGGILEPKDLGTQPRPKNYHGGEPESVTIDLGGLAFTLDLSTSSPFGVRYMVPKDLRGVLIGALTRIQIKKAGVRYNNVRQCEQAGFWKENCEYQVWEEGIFHVEAIDVWVNGKPAYSTSGLGVVFEGQLTRWSNDLRANSVWGRLMRDTACDQDQ